MDKETINEYNKHREYLINNMRNYIHGNLSPQQRQEYEKRNKRASELSREIDSYYMSKNHQNDNQFWENWTRMHN